MAWHFFVQGGGALSDLDDPVSGGLHLYAALPILQIGPVALVSVWLFSPLGPHGGLVAAEVFGALAGLVILGFVRHLARDAQPDPTAGQVDPRLATAMVFFTPVWMYLAVGSAHLDDVLALLLATIGLYAVKRQRPVAAGILFGLAVDCKPWALAFGCLLVLGNRRAQVIGAIATAATIALAWSPFLLVDPATTNAFHFTIPNTTGSGLRAIGIDTARTPPWDRPAQAAFGVGLGLLAIRRGRWAAVILLVVAARIVLDPGTNRYYTAGLAVGALIWDVVGSRSRWPWWSIGVFSVLYASRWAQFPAAVYGWLTVGFFLVCATLAVKKADTTRLLPS
jgi:hypothetical protein